MGIGDGTSIGWDGYEIRTPNNKTAANVMFNDNSFVITNTESIELHLPYPIVHAWDNQQSEMQHRTDPSGNAILYIPSGTDYTVNVRREEP
ncbi:MAG: hypothetical protein LAT52_05555 [Balneolales bacterium]|nr:hypothetical protein [Balneolales bacterium]